MPVEDLEERNHAGLVFQQLPSIHQVSQHYGDEESWDTSQLVVITNKYGRVFWVRSDHSVAHAPTHALQQSSLNTKDIGTLGNLFK